MFLLFEVKSVAALKAIVVSIPEPVGLLVFGIVLVIAAALLRTFFVRAEKVKAEEKLLNEA